MLKQAFNTPPMQGPIQYVGSISKSPIVNKQSVPANKPNVASGKQLTRNFPRHLSSLGAGIGGGTLSYPSPKLRRVQALMRSNTTPNMSMPKTHTDALLMKLMQLEPPRKKGISKRQEIRNARKRENALDYLESTDRQAFLKYRFGSDYFNR